MADVILVHYADGENGVFVAEFDNDQDADAFRAEHADVLTTPEGQPVALADAASSPAVVPDTQVAPTDPATASTPTEAVTGAQTDPSAAGTVSGISDPTAAPDAAATPAADAASTPAPDSGDSGSHDAVAPDPADGPVTAQDAPPVAPVVPSETDQQTNSAGTAGDGASADTASGSGVSTDTAAAS